MGINKSKIIIGDFLDREFSYSRQEILDFIIKARKKIKPTCVFTQASDLHQDHQVCHDETIRAFRNQTIIEYFVPRSMYKSKPTLYVKLSKKELDAKIQSLSYYKTFKNKQFFHKDAIMSMSKSQGIPLEITICEAFNPIWIII